MTDTHNQRLIEYGFPCHQVGAETQRERGASSALPPLYYLHVWWARRPLTPSRAAVLASLLPAEADTNTLLRQLGIERVEALLSRDVGVPEPWVINEDKVFDRIEHDKTGQEWLVVDALVLRRLESENQRRAKNRELIQDLVDGDPQLIHDALIQRWRAENEPLPEPLPRAGARLRICRVAADPAFAKERIEWETAHGIRSDDDKYGYGRAFTKSRIVTEPTGLTVLDPTAGDGSIPFEALRLGHTVIANELNSVATIILYATLDYPLRFGPTLLPEIRKWGHRMRDSMVAKIGDLFPVSPLHGVELQALRAHLHNNPELVDQFVEETLDGFLYCRQVTCPYCGGKAPLLNSCWLAKGGEQWGVGIIPDPQTRDVLFEPYRVKKDAGPKGEDLDLATVTDGVGTCIHCKQAIPGDEIKRQARGESGFGTWIDRLYCVVAVRYQPKLDKQGKIERYKSGERKGEIKTEKVTFFRSPNARDLEALETAKRRLDAKWDEWDTAGMIPTEALPKGEKTREPQNYGMLRWCDMFTPRQLLGHLTLVEELNRLKPQILQELGEERGRAIVTYCQFAIDKGVDYNSRFTRWIPQRGSVSGTFSRHDFSLKWTFGEIVFTGPHSGMAWGLSQVLDAYKGICELLGPQNKPSHPNNPCVQILHGTAAYLQGVADASVDLVCIDPPYYNNVQYAELSDFYYVWQRRTLVDLYPDILRRRLTNKQDEAVANPAREGSNTAANAAYKRMMQDVFSECRRVLKAAGVMTLMFTHKSQDAWETLTRSLIESGWVITASFPVDSEFSYSQHIMDNASAESSIIIVCRKRFKEAAQPATWTGFGGTGVQHRVAQAVAEALPHFESLRLNPVDKMVASYGQALRVLSEQWPVLDGDEPVSPMRAMNEASRVVAERQIVRLTQERLQVNDLKPEAAMALTLYGIYGLHELPYDEALNLSRSLNIRLDSRPAGYTVEGRIIGINQDTGSQRRSTSREAESTGYHAPLIRKGSKLRLARPEERHTRRLEHPQTEWDVLHGLIMAYRHGDIPVARAYLQQHANSRQQVILDLLHVWAAGTSDEALRKEGQTIVFGLK